MAQAVVDEAIRNVLCVGAEYGTEESVLALVDNFCWPDPVGNPLKTAWLVRACYGLRDAALALSAPLVSGKDSMKNDFRGKCNGEDVTISVPPTLLMTAVGRVQDTKLARTADFKTSGDVIYLLGGTTFGLLGSEYHALSQEVPATKMEMGGTLRVGRPDWPLARRVYSWIGGAQGKLQAKVKSLHDVSEGGILVSVAESLLAKGLGATLRIPADRNPWEFMYGEGFHSFVASAAEADASGLETEWNENQVPFLKLGVVENRDRVEVFYGGEGTMVGSKAVLNVGVKQLRAAWLKEGYWE
jgi:phosphoribosylformylglycinamidine (FGAM) synthase-like enzyme